LPLFTENPRRGIFSETLMQLTGSLCVCPRLWRRRDEASASYEHQGYLLCVQNHVIGEELTVARRVLAYMLEVSWNTLAKKNARSLAY